MKITVIDAVMGQGKSSFAIEMINNSPDNDYIVIVPNLSEVERYQLALDRVSVAPEVAYDIVTGRSTKLTGFRELVENGQTIVSTHSMLKNFDDRTLRAVKGGQYTLVLDEVVELIEPFNDVNQYDFETYVASGIFKKQEVLPGIFRILPGSTEYWESGWAVKFMRDVRDGHMYQARGSFFVWMAPPEQLEAFKHVFILTYMFKGSVMASWLDHFQVPYELKTVSRLTGALLAYWDEGGRAFRHLVKLNDDPKINQMKSKKTESMGATWFKKAPTKTLKKTNADMITFFKSTGLSNDKCLYSCHMSDKGLPILNPRGYVTSTKKKLSYLMGIKDHTEKARDLNFIPVNMKASNLYKEREAVAYPFTMYPHQALKVFFQDSGIPFDEDRYALSEMIQLLWRSAIRDGKEVNLYIPSYRMRTLFLNWLNPSSIG